MIPAARLKRVERVAVATGQPYPMGLGVDAHVDVGPVVWSHLGEDDVVYPLMHADEVVYAPTPVTSEYQVHVPVTNVVVLVPVAPVESSAPGLQLAGWLPGFSKQVAELTLRRSGVSLLHMSPALRRPPPQPAVTEQGRDKTQKAFHN